MRVKRMSETTKDVAVVQHRLYRYKKASAISQERVEATFRILLADEHVRAVLINVFSGVRLEVINVEDGQRVLRDSGLNFIVADGMKDATEKVVAVANQQQAAA